VGRSCDKCKPGYWAFPYCQLCDCDMRGTTAEICSQVTRVSFLLKPITSCRKSSSVILFLFVPFHRTQLNVTVNQMSKEEAVKRVSLDLSTFKRRTRLDAQNAFALERPRDVLRPTCSGHRFHSEGTPGVPCHSIPPSLLLWRLHTTWNILKMDLRAKTTVHSSL